MSLLTIAQSVSLRVLSQKPAVAAASTDPKVLQIVELINEDGQELGARHSWQVLTAEATFNTLAAESQGLITAIAGPDYSFTVNETMWNRTQRRPVFGPKSPSEWQNLKAQFSSGPWVSWRLRGNQVLFFPIPAAGQAVFFEWCTKFWCTTSNGATGQSSFVVDTDISKLDERLHVLGGIWRFKKANNLAYEEDFNKYEAAVNDAISRDGAKPRLNLTGAPNELSPVVLVPVGNWMVS